MKKLRTFIISLLLVPVLTLNANAFTSDADAAVYTPPQDAAVHTAPQQSMCWFFFAGSWWLLPC
jgi:hypothetical protein